MKRHPYTSFQHLAILRRQWRCHTIGTIIISIWRKISIVSTHAIAQKLPFITLSLKKPDISRGKQKFLSISKTNHVFHSPLLTYSSISVHGLYSIIVQYCKLLFIWYGWSEKLTSQRWGNGDLPLRCCHAAALVKDCQLWFGWRRNKEITQSLNNFCFVIVFLHLQSIALQLYTLIVSGNVLPNRFATNFFPKMFQIRAQIHLWTENRDLSFKFF